MRALTVVAAMLLALDVSPGSATSCGAPTPFLRIARDAEVVFIGRVEDTKDGSGIRVETVLRGADVPSLMPHPGGLSRTKPGARAIFASYRVAGEDVDKIPQCGEGAVTIAGEWVLGRIAEGGTVKSIWRAARLSDVIQAIFARATTVEVVSAEEAIPHVPRPGMGVDIEVDLHVDCIAATPFLTTRALIDENGVVVHPMWIDGISECVRSGTLSALHRARVPPVYVNGLPGAAWIDLRIALLAQRQGVSCGGARPMRPPAAIVALDGHRIVITAPRSSVAAALPAQFEVAQGTERMAALLEELDRYSAPRLAEYRDDEPCDPPLRDLRWVPGDVLGMQSILDRALCVSYDDESECARSEGGSRVPKAEPDKRNDEAVQITAVSDDLAIPAGLFSGDVVLLVLTPGLGVRPRSGPLHRLPERLIVAGDAAREWPRLYAEFLEGLCRGDQTFLLEWASDPRAFDVTFTPESPEMEEWQALGATWYVPAGGGPSPRLNLTRLRILGSSSSPIHLAFEEHPREADGTIWARHDFPVTPNACGAAQRYAREAENRRAEEERNRVRLMAPLGNAQ